MTTSTPVERLFEQYTQRQPLVVELARRLALCARIESALLRSARLTFLPTSEPGVEADLWFSPLIQARSSLYLALRADVAALLRRDLAAKPDELNKTWAWLHNWRERHPPPPALALEEHVTYLALAANQATSDHYREQIETLLQRAVASMADPLQAGALASWAARALPRMPALVHATESSNLLAISTALHLRNRPVIDLHVPGASTAEKLKRILPTTLATITVGIRLLEGEVEIGDPSMEYAQTLNVPRTNPVVLAIASGDSAPIPVRWPAGSAPVRIAIQGNEVRIRTLLGDEYRLRGVPATPEIPAASWGLQVTRVLESPYTGRGVRVALLGTGIDLNHPDFANRRIINRSFISDEDIQDRNGITTHTAGIICGPIHPHTPPRYGIAPDVELYVGKVMSDRGTGTDHAILAGLEWAIEERCEIIMADAGTPLSHNSAPFSEVFEKFAQRALAAGSLIVMPAGSNSRRPADVQPVVHPANCPSILAIGAIASDLTIASFSNGATSARSRQIDLVGPGVELRSSWTGPEQYRLLSGSSVAAAHVVGIAALIAEANPTARGPELAALIRQSAHSLPFAAGDVGLGLVQAPAAPVELTTDMPPPTQRPENPLRRRQLQDLVIMLPGMMGSVLQRNERDIWAFSGQAFLQFLTSIGTSINELYLERDDPEQEMLTDGIITNSVIEDTFSIPGLIEGAGFGKLIRSIEQRFSAVRGDPFAPRDDANLFPFPYDWRRDVRVLARQLKRFVNHQLPIWRTTSGNPDAQVIIIAHSIGALGAYYWAEVLGGWQQCGSFISLGGSFRGTPEALDYLANGWNFATFDLSEVIRSFTSIYQLLPTYPMINRNGTFLRVSECPNLPNVDQERVIAAQAFHQEIADAVQRNSTVSGYHSRLIPFVGLGKPTNQSAIFEDGRITLSQQYSLLSEEHLDGDGSIPKISAVPLVPLAKQYDQNVYFENMSHGELLRNNQVLEHIYLLIDRLHTTKDLR